MSNKQVCLLKLFVTTYSTSSNHAIRNLKEILLEIPETNVKLEIIDIQKDPEVAVKENVIAVPLLIKKSGAKCCQKLIGDMSNRPKVITWLTHYQAS